MAWALQFDGVNDYLTINTFYFMSQETWSVSAKYDVQEGAGIRIFGHKTSWRSYITINITDIKVRYNSEGQEFIFAVNISELQNKLIEIVKTGYSSHSLYIDGVFHSENTSNTASWSHYGVNAIAQANNSFGSDLHKLLSDITVVCNNPRTYSPEASSHSNTGSQPIIIDTISGNNAIGVNMPTDGSAWVDLGGGGTEQTIATVTAQQLTESELVNITSFNVINAIICEQVTQSHLSDLMLDNQVSTVIAEQLTECLLSAIATSNSLTAVITEQLTHAINTDIQQLLSANSVTAEQISESVIVNVDESAGIFVSAVQAEQLTQAIAANIDVVSLANAVITEQITQTINTDIQQLLLVNTATAEQLTEAVIVTVDESFGIFVSAVQAEQLTQYSTQQINVDLTVPAVIAEQLTQAELITIIVQNLATQLNIDIDQISLQILTPTYRIESLTPIYTIKHLH